MPDSRPGSLLILGGTGEALALAGALAEAMPDLPVTTSLAGRTRDPVLPIGGMRIGGFGGDTGLARYLRENQVSLLINATHPYAAQISTHAVEAHRMTGIPLLRLIRPAWAESPGDSWIHAASAEAAAVICRGLGERILLTLGTRDLARFAGVERAYFLVRMVDPPDRALPLDRYEIIAARGPFALDDERRLLLERKIDLIVAKNSGGAATFAKITAARELKIPVVMIERPEIARHPRCDAVESVPDALAWIGAQTERSLRTGENKATAGDKA